MSPDWKTLAITDLALVIKDSSVRLVDMTDQDIILKVRGNQPCFAMNGKVLVTIGRKQIRWFDVGKKQATEVRSDAVAENITLVASPDGRYIAALQYDTDVPSWSWHPPFLVWNSSPVARLVIFDAATKRAIATLGPVHSGAKVQFSMDSAMLAVATKDRAMAVWSMPPRKPVWLAASLAAALVAAAWALRLGYRRFRRRGASGVADKGPLPA
jgi:hypothetical protein